MLSERPGHPTSSLLWSFARLAPALHCALLRPKQAKAVADFGAREAHFVADRPRLKCRTHQASLLSPIREHCCAKQLGAYFAAHMALLHAPCLDLGLKKRVACLPAAPAGPASRAVALHGKPSKEARTDDSSGSFTLTLWVGDDARCVVGLLLGRSWFQLQLLDLFLPLGDYAKAE